MNRLGLIRTPPSTYSRCRSMVQCPNTLWKGNSNFTGVLHRRAVQTKAGQTPPVVIRHASQTSRLPVGTHLAACGVCILERVTAYSGLVLSRCLLSTVTDDVPDDGAASTSGHSSNKRLAKFMNQSSSCAAAAFRRVDASAMLVLSTPISPEPVSVDQIDGGADAWPTPSCSLFGSCDACRCAWCSQHSLAECLTPCAFLCC